MRITVHSVCEHNQIMHKERLSATFNISDSQTDPVIDAQHWQC